MITALFTPPVLSVFNYSFVYLVGIKGVAQTSLAQMLIDAGIRVAGCDVAEEFVTQPHLDALGISIDVGFPHTLPAEVECVVYTSAHQAEDNPTVQQAIQTGIPVMSQAEAVASFFNHKNGIAVCGVGGKSTTSAMLAWVFECLKLQPSYSVGVGDIPCLARTGRWAEGEHCIIEADEYVTNPTMVAKGKAPIPRFQYLQPNCIVCTGIVYDHPDVYSSLEQTIETFHAFFLSLKPNGFLITHAQDAIAQQVAQQVQTQRPDITHITFGASNQADVSLISQEHHSGSTSAQVMIDGQNYSFTLPVPGTHNILNATACLAVCHAYNLSLATACQDLAGFTSTKRRFEYKGKKNRVTYYDDYAHHPREIKAILDTVARWENTASVVIAFQPHTYSRTKQLFDEFVSVLAQAKQVVLLDIFASAREKSDTSISSDMLVDAVQRSNPACKITNLKNITQLSEYCETQLLPGSICITLGAGDIYQVYDRLGL